MIPTHTITFRVRALGRFRLSPTRLQLLEMDPEAHELEAYATEKAADVFGRLNGTHILPLEDAMPKMPDQFMVDPDAIVVEEIEDLNYVPPVLPDGAIY